MLVFTLELNGGLNHKIFLLCFLFLGSRGFLLLGGRLLEGRFLFFKRSSFITLKDHGENFKINPKCRLINPAKSEIRIISKEYIDNINKIIREKANVNQWRNTDPVVTWF